MRSMKWFTAKLPCALTASAGGLTPASDTWVSQLMLMHDP
jgi:hypothetical protein